MTQFIFKKATVLGLIGTITLVASILPARAHQREKDHQDASPSGCQIDPGFYIQGCVPTHPIDQRPARDRNPQSGSCDPNRLTRNWCSSDEPRSDEWIRRPRPDNGLPPCGIVYNGPCDPKKGI
jgi:hypothetical protein